MSSSNPIIPPGSPLQRTQPANQSKLLLSVFAIVTIHVALLAGLLIQGCQRQETSAPPPEGVTVDNASAPPPMGNFDTEPKNTPSTPAPAPSANTLPALPAQPETVPAPRPETANPTPPGVATEPAPTVVRETPPTLPTPPATVPATPPASETVRYVVKAGDTLTKIARNHHTTVQAIRSANNLKTDRILVGQKLKVPAPTNQSNSTPPAGRPADAAPPTPTP